MKQPFILKHEFVKHIPEKLANGTIYVSIDFTTAAHQCCCGCGKDVITPLSPTDWKLIFDGETVSLHPSIGNWNYPCRSHYWIARNRVEWAPQWSREQIQAGQARDQGAKEKYFAARRLNADDTRAVAGLSNQETPDDLLSQIKNWWRRT